MRIILDTAILVRGHGSSQGLAHDLLISIVESNHILLLSNEMLYELARVQRYPRMLALHGLSEKRIYDYVGFLREAAELVVPNPLLVTPIRDVNDTVVMQTAVIGEADILCTKDPGFLRTFGGRVSEKSRDSRFGRHLADAPVAFLTAPYAHPVPIRKWITPPARIRSGHQCGRFRRHCLRIFRGGLSPLDVTFP